MEAMAVSILNGSHTHTSKLSHHLCSSEQGAHNLIQVRGLRNRAMRQGVSGRQVIEASSVFTAAPCHLRFRLSSIHLLSDQRQHYVLIGV